MRRATRDRPRGRGWAVLTVASLVASLCGLGLGLGAALPARASFATQCASPTRTLSPGASAISVAPGETVLLAGGAFTGGVDSLPSGATLCVAPGASLVPPYLNNAMGSLIVAAGGGIGMPFIAVASGFELQVEGDATFAGLNINGSATIRVAAGGTLAVTSSFSPGTGDIQNAGTMHIAGAMNLNSAVSLANSGAVVVDGGANVNGTLTNTGTLQVTGTLVVNGSGTLQNGCALQVSGDLSNNGPGSLNSGVAIVGGLFTNNGSWSQATSGTLAASRLTDDGRVTGFGQYLFTGATSVQGSFTGDSAGAPIIVDTAAPPDRFFDVQTGTVANLVRGSVITPRLATYPSPDCSLVRPSADLVVSKTGPATVLAGSTIAYDVEVVNAGPGSAAGVTIVDTVPTGVTPTSASNGGVVTTTSVTWNLGDLGPDTAVALTVAGTVTAAPGSTLLNVVAGSSATPDPNPANNDGSSEAAQATTLVDAVIPPNQVPVADDQTLQGTTGSFILGQATASDPDAGQSLTYTVVTPPVDGTIVMLPGGAFSYRGDPAFTGIDTAVFQVCDNGDPPACARATLTFEVFPVASDDLAQTFRDEPVVVPLIPNDSTPGAVLSPAPVSGPANGTVLMNAVAGTATYTPSAGFVGTDSFVFSVCSPTAPALCDSATVTVTVLPPSSPPVIEDLLLRTVTNAAVQGALVISNPDGDAVTAHPGVLPRTGTSTVGLDGATSYTPRRGFAGRDFYTAFACSARTPDLCAQATVTVEVSPIARDDVAQTAVGDPVTIDVLGNDSGSVLPPTVATAPARGVVSTVGVSLVYTPDPGFSGTDAFTYTICASTAPDLCATAGVSITVTAATLPTPEPTPPPETGSTSAGSGSLPDTGSDIAAALLWAALLVIAGAALAVAARRRRKRG